MERLALIGVSHRRGGAAALEAWQAAFKPPYSELAGLGFAEWVPIVTCNRWDVVVALPKTMDVAQARALLTPTGQLCRPYAYTGDGALEQLTRIAASLDSLNPGEDQIMAQVRSAFAAAQAAGSTGPLTSFAFHTALRIAKKVRREVALAPLKTSLFSLARPDLLRALPQGGSVAVLGAGEMGSLAAKTLASEPGFDLLIVNRSAPRARQLARHLGARSSSLEAFLAAPPPVDALVCATPVRALIDPLLVQRLPELKLIIDLGVPRNVHPEVIEASRVRVLDVDTLQAAGRTRREALQEKLAAAEVILQEALEGALEAWTERQLGPSIQRLRQLYLATTLDALGDGVGSEEAARLAHRFAHVPVKGLRAVARTYGLEAAQMFLAEAGLGELRLGEAYAADASRE
ncbi:NAD(P)-binding domain-containing protein [Truepera radiovictrix]|uniref:Glutamyl-tRNA reductase n=1 Tax=Truepera radiovictrix (strain DSM 17093 / CIP 108686 / LMG 22925 / RQ-24) TaxID=649638 RepID=D7CY08_TRURR|nr:NAD(P)-binding domain-containing protein [Truepera radiovictrix]ADI13368.1 Glutamyl-tRNA reductase [Truepera radiovictrix DSM 17093]WMT58069.1 NAD(P)-binding domain-containing protein [Truepera radiovictrix]